MCVNDMLNLEANVVSMDRIVHFDELKIDKFIYFSRLFFAGNFENIEVSEKVDGQNFSFGLDENDVFFTKTKQSSPIINESIYGDFSFMQPLKSYHKTLYDNIELLTDIKSYVKDKLKLSKNYNFQVFAEIVPSPQTNMITYNDNTIGDGALVLFDIKVNGDSILHLDSCIDISNNIIDKLHTVGGWKFYNKPLIYMNNFNLPMDNIDELEFLYNSHVNILKSRKKADKMIKDQVKATIHRLQNEIKSQLIESLTMDRESCLGNSDIEGLVFRSFSDNMIIKLVDKDKFSKENYDASSYISDVVTTLKKVNNTIKSEIFGNADILKNFKKVIEKSVDWLLIMNQNDKNYTISSIDDILQVIYNDILSEGLIQLSRQHASGVARRRIAELRTVIVRKYNELNINKSNIPVSKYTIALEKMHVYNSWATTTINKLNDSTIDIYFTLILFVLGEIKFNELKIYFNIQ